MVGQFEPLTADLQDIAVLEGHRRGRPVRVIVAQQAEVLGVPDADHVRAEQGRGADVIGVRMRVDHVSNRAGHPIGGGDRIDRAQQVAADGGRGVDEHDAFWGGQEHGLIERVGHPVEGVVDGPGDVAVRVQRRAECRRRHGCVTGRAG